MLDTNRREVLQLLLVLLSQSMYFPLRMSISSSLSFPHHGLFRSYPTSCCITYTLSQRKRACHGTSESHFRYYVSCVRAHTLTRTLPFPFPLAGEYSSAKNKFLQHLTTTSHVRLVPLVCSLLNTVCTYDPVGYGVPFNYLLVEDHKQELVMDCLHLLLVLLDHSEVAAAPVHHTGPGAPSPSPAPPTARPTSSEVRRWSLRR